MSMWLLLLCTTTKLPHHHLPQLPTSTKNHLKRINYIKVSPSISLYSLFAFGVVLFRSWKGDYWNPVTSMDASFQFSNLSSLVKGFGSAVGRASFFGWYRLRFLTLARLQSIRTASNFSQSRLLPFSIDTLHVVVESNKIHRISYENIHQA